MSSAIREKVEAYFASINPIARRIMTDISLAKEQYGNDWNTLSEEEQEEALWRAVVQPEVEKKFEKKNKDPDVEYFPALRVKTGERIIVDEEGSTGKPFGSSWRDEHSAPFCWETQSQMDLTLFGSEKKHRETPRAAISASSLSTVVSTTPKDEKRDDLKRQTIKRPSVPPPPVPPHASPPVPPHASGEESPPVPPHAEKSEMPIYAKVVKRKVNAKTLVISEMKAHKKAMEEMKPAVPPRMSLELQIDIDPTTGEVTMDSFETIPKTGFDFLDNW